MADVALKNITKVYPGGAAAVDDISMAIGDGEFAVLVGPSGCGKSTTLRMIAGLERITSGELTIGDRVVNEVEPGDRNIAMVFQNYALYPHMSVRKNMSYGLKNEGHPKDVIEARIAEAAEMLRLTELLDRKPRQLSGGQRQRAAMGRAIVRQPEVFLFDEPLSNLDAKLRTQLRAELKALHQRLNVTFVYVTHDQIEAMSMADRIVVMNEGRIEQIGAPLDIYSAPASRFVAEFIGNPAMNILDGKITGDGSALTDGERDLVRFAEPVPLQGRHVALGVRPEHLSAGDHGKAQLTLTPSFHERLGADTLVHCHLGEGGGETIILRHDGQSTPPEAGFTASANALHWFDVETGQRLSVG